MTLKNSLKLLGFAPIVIYIVINRFFSLTIGEKIPLLIIVGIISIGSLVLQEKLIDKISRARLIMLSISFAITMAIYAYFINTP